MRQTLWAVWPLRQLLGKKGNPKPIYVSRYTASLSHHVKQLTLVFYKSQAGRFFTAFLGLFQYGDLHWADSRFLTISRGIHSCSHTVVAYDLGVEQSDRSCKQTAIARSEKSVGRNESDRYFIIRHQSSCPQLIPEERLKVDCKRSFKLKRNTKCDKTLGELKYFSFLSPIGVRTESPRLEDRARLE